MIECRCHDMMNVHGDLADTDEFGTVLSRGPFTTTESQADPVIAIHAIHWVLTMETYATKRRNQIGEWTYIPTVSDSDTVVYSKGNHVIIAFKGSTTLVDIHNDIILSKPGHACRFPKAATMSLFVQRVLEEDPTTLIQLTGHSLGGAIARCVGSRLGLGAVTFNPAAPPSSPAPTFGNQIHYHIVFDIISAWQAGSVRIDKGHRPKRIRRFAFITKLVSKYFYNVAIGPMIKAHLLENFSNEKKGEIMTSDQEMEVWKQWFDPLPHLIQRLFFLFTQTSHLPPIP